MAKLNGKEMTRQDILRSVGHISQLARARQFELLTGRGGGGRAVEIATGGGLEFTLLQDKCLDVLDMRYKGVNLGFVAKAGVTAPQYYNPHINEFPYYFQGGLLATCGLRNAGAAGEDEGEMLTPHGRIGNSPADNVGISARWEGDEYLLSVSGDVRESALFRENIVLRRRVETKLGAQSFRIADRVDNETCRAEPVMILYHINFGFPFLGPDLKLILPRGAGTKPRDAEAAKGMAGFHAFEAPVDGYPEQVFYHRMLSLPGGDTCVMLRNRALDIAVTIRYNVGQLPVTTQWKSMGSGDYALGIEPGNCHVEGRANERRLGSLQMLEPFGSAEFGVEIGVLEGAEIDAFAGSFGLELE